MSGTVCDCGHPEAQHLTLATSNRCAVAVGSVGGKAQVCGCLGFEELSDWERERRAAVPFLTAPSPAADEAAQDAWLASLPIGERDAIVAPVLRFMAGLGYSITHPAAPSPAAEPLEGLREALALWLCAERNGEAAWDYPLVRTGWRADADRILAGPLAPLLARAATDRAAVERCEALVEHADRMSIRTVLSIRRALSGDAR